MDSFAKERRKIKGRFVIFTLGILLNFAGYFVLLSLQSSINIEEGLGYKLLTSTYLTAAFFACTFTPICIRNFGPKTCLLLCEFLYLQYILVNLYPVSYLLIPAGILTGIGEAMLWPVITLFVVHFGKDYARYGKKSPNVYVTQFIGSFFSVFQMSSVTGNLLSYAILYGGKSSNTTLNSSTTSSNVKDLSICGKNDCQDPNITIANESRYEPASKLLIYVLIGVMASLVIFALVIHKFLIKPIDTNSEIEDENKNKSKTGKNKKLPLKYMLQTIKSTLVQLINPKQLLLTPLTTFSGFFMFHILSEMTRSFVSCMLGVEQVGLAVALNGISFSLSSAIISKISSVFGRDIHMVVGYCLNLSTCLLCLLWHPTESSLWLVYFIFILLGLTNGNWQPFISGLYASYFPDNLDIALTVWNVYNLLGIVWQASWSTSLCVYMKIYIQIGFLSFSAVCYCVLRVCFNEKQFSREDQSDTSPEEQELTVSLRTIK